MKKTKLILTILLCITAISFIACSSPSNSGSDNSGNTGTAGTSGVDTGTSGVDTGISGVDTGISGTDTGTSGTDTGTSGTGTGSSGTSGTGTGGTEGTGGSGGGDSGETGGGNENPPVTYIGTKAPSEAKAVGDIVFNDGSAMAYTDFAALDDDAKNAKKTSAIALIFYKGTGLNSDDSEGNADTITNRTLGVGLKHNRRSLGWCSSANAYRKNITTIQCSADGETGSLTFTGYKNGSDNLEQIASFLTTNSSTDDTATAANYPAFYFGKNYATSTVTNIAADSEFATGWYLPSIAELFQIYANGKGTNKVFDIDAASEALGGDKFGISSYWSSSQSAYQISFACGLVFGLGGCTYDWKYGSDMDDYVCCIRDFN